jgi:hypothetical protein
MNFGEWLNVNEARWRGPVGGAFGNDKRRMQRKPQPPKPVEPAYAPNPATPSPAAAGQRMDNRFQDINARVQYGKGIERQIFDSLVACGLKLRQPSGREDMIDKIDGWWDDGSGQEKPIQIKYRDTGDDILFEVMKDYHRGVPGRDMVGKAVYYAVLDRNGGHIVMVQVAEAKSLIQAAVDAAEQEGFDDRGNYRFRTGGGVVFLRIRPDPQSGQDKLMAYIPVRALNSVRDPCKASVRF